MPGNAPTLACTHCGTALHPKFLQSSAGRYRYYARRKGLPFITACPHCGQPLAAGELMSMASKARVARRKRPHKPKKETRPCQYCGVPLLGWLARKQHEPTCLQRPCRYCGLVFIKGWRFRVAHERKCPERTK